MQKLLFFLFISFSLKSSAQDFIKINPIRSLLGEVHLFYERQLPNPKRTILYKFGVVYPNKVVKSVTDMSFGDIYDGYNTGFVSGIYLRKYPGREKNSFFYQLGIDSKILKMGSFSHRLDSRSSVDIEGRHFTLNPRLFIGYRSGKNYRLNVYWGIGGSIRWTKVTDFTRCTFVSQELCERIKSGEYKIVTSPIVGPTIHLGILVSLYQFNRQKEQE